MLYLNWLKNGIDSQFKPYCLHYVSVPFSIITHFPHTKLKTPNLSCDHFRILSEAGTPRTRHCQHIGRPPRVVGLAKIDIFSEHILESTHKYRKACVTVHRVWFIRIRKRRKKRQLFSKSKRSSLTLTAWLNIGVKTVCSVKIRLNES